VHVAGRAHDLSTVARDAAAIVSCWFPGDEGAGAIVDALFGDVNPAGRCPVTFSRGAGQQPTYYDNRPLSRQPYGAADAEPVFPFGHGLSYTSFDYDALTLDETVPTDGTLHLACRVTNVGGRAGDEVVQVYVRDEVASVVRPVMELRAFARVHLRVGQHATVAFEIPTDALAFTGRDLERIVEPGTLTVLVGASSADIRLTATTNFVGPMHRARADPTARGLTHRTTVTEGPVQMSSSGIPTSLVGSPGLSGQ
jgi:beta-glucosidase